MDDLAHAPPDVIPTGVADEIRAWFREDRSRMTMMAARKFAGSMRPRRGLRSEAHCSILVRSPHHLRRKLRKKWPRNEDSKR